MKFILTFFLAPFLTLVGGVILGVYIRDFPKFSIEYTVKITDILGVIVTFTIGIFIPLLVKRLIDDKRNIKNSLVDEVNSLLKMVIKIDEKISLFHTSGKLTKQNKDEIILFSELSDDEFNTLYEFVHENCSAQCKVILVALKAKYLEYWNIATSNSILSSKVKLIADNDLIATTKKFNEIKDLARRLKININRM